MQGIPKAIEIKGIVRNATVIGAQDGQAEDLINLRFMDGSWRASGDGRLIQFTMGRTYSQLYVHTNIYHHLLGVYEGTLYWFAEIGTDGTSFYPLDNTTSRTQWPEDMQDLPTKPKRLTEVVGNIWITQNGHLLTVIDENDDFEHFVFKTGEDEYIGVDVDVNGKQTDRSLYPFGQVHFNYVSQNNSKYVKTITVSTGVSVSGNKPNNTSIETLNNLISTELAKHKTKNIFTGSLMVLCALKLYDDSYTYASQPVYIHPFDCMNNLEEVVSVGNMSAGLPVSKVAKSNYIPFYYDLNWWRYDDRDEVHKLFFIKNGKSVKITQSDSADYIVHNDDIVCSTLDYMPTLAMHYDEDYGAIKTRGYELALSIEDVDFLNKNKDIFKSLCVFVTVQEHAFDLNDKENILYGKFTEQQDLDQPENYYYAYYPSKKSKDKVIHSLLNSPFYLLKEYDNLSELADNPIIDLSAAKDEGLLNKLLYQPTLENESTNRTTYLPKVSYMYNGRLHIANYKSYPFFGYPIDLFNLHNHSVKVQNGSWFKGVLPNLADNNDAYLQYPKAQKEITNYDDLVQRGAPFFLVKVYIDSSQGEQVVCRYIPAYNPSPAVNGRADFIEDLNPLLTYPDVRAKKMEIFYVDNYTTEDWDDGNYTYLACAWVKKGEFTLKPHPYLNIAYHIDPNLKPIKLSEFTSEVEIDNVEATIKSKTIDELIALAKMQNAEEYFPNGLKVSKTDQPMVFPVENTYQVGSAEILALMSNTIAVGTGQTGNAPLYIFCKDGVYAAFVDASGEMVYPNTRPLAPDVCNNPRSVTKTDLGVVFTTDRGLMRMNGNAVEEIGQPAEGDVVHFVDPTKVDYSKYATDALTKIARLPSSLCDTMDFLTYLQGAIINYNHNMRELIVTNPTKSYSYVLDREGNWSRRTYTAKQYVSNYPTSYRLTNDGYFFKMDEEGDVNTSLEHRKEADNSIFYISNVIKLDSIGFKQAYRFVVRGYFETQMIDHSLLHLSDVSDVDEEGFILVDHIPVDRFGYINIDEMGVDDEGYIVPNGVTTQEIIKQFDLEQHVGIVVEGSYDGIKFNPLGFNRRTGKFRDIGCLVSHTDMRFFRICLSGQVTGKTRIDYMEMSAGASMLNTKIR